MIGILKIILLLLLVKTGLFQSEAISGDKVIHRVEVIHPGIDPVMPVERFLVELKGKNGKVKTYYMDVETVVCGDANCRIDTVRIFWNKYGFYDRLDLPKGVQLEKAGGENFTEEDYKKLDIILSNKKADLKDVFKEEIVEKGTGEGIDAISGATILINSDDYVKGAVWTCYTLWHWVNGDVYSHVRRITGREMPLEELLGYLKNEDLAGKYFALEELLQRNFIDERTVQIVIDELGVNEYLFSKLTLEYLEIAPDSLYNSSMDRFFKKGDTKQKVLCLNALSQSGHAKFPELFGSIGAELSLADDYQVLDLFLNLLDETGGAHQFVINKLIPLLWDDNFLISRRVYWFLNDKSLPEDMRRKLEEYRGNHKGKL